MSKAIDRRAFIRKGGLTTAGLAVAGTGLPALLAACGSSKSTTSSPTTSSSATTAAPGAAATVAPGTYGSMSFQLSWVKNVEFAGEYIADTNGYYADEGFSSVNLLTGGPNVAQDAVVAAGKALSGISSPDITGPAVLQGAPLVIVAAQYQKNPFAIMSLAKSPIMNPQEMIGKKIGIQSTNNAVWQSFLKANGIKSSQVHEVPVQFDPSPLAAGQVDGWFSFITNEPIELAAQGVKTYTFLLNDFNYPLVSETYMVQKSTLSNAAARTKLKSFLVAEIMGWQQSLKNPVLGAQLAVQKYGPSLGNTVAEQTQESEAQNKLILDARTMTEGILTITPEQVAQNIATLAIGGNELTASQLFDLSVIDEVYAENPQLKTFTV
jgi:ABC-type nitrate/sulfonate/bicarbonate transport system substrate-binding protein